ncbi:MAG: hypothetical protein FWC50_09995 [Planctomycetaceae bacterium]|nr:hypothetical protein [Planctomycetaceae bacterium]
MGRCTQYLTGCKPMISINLLFFGEKPMKKHEILKKTHLFYPQTRRLLVIATIMTDHGRRRAFFCFSADFPFLRMISKCFL